ncbi:MAG: hypothetical protein AAB635_01385 [Patescibacteria group bacterium]
MKSLLLDLEATRRERDAFQRLLLQKDSRNNDEDGGGDDREDGDLLG